LLVNNVILGYWILDCWYEMSYKATQYKNYSGLNNQQKNVVIMCVEKQIKVLLCFRQHQT
jgi:arginyl-tRNA--protein-N-Asp/Glu arginylyltransferase